MKDHDAPAPSPEAVSALAFATVAQLDDIVEDLSAASDYRAAAKLWMAAKAGGASQEDACLAIMLIQAKAGADLK